MLVAAFIAAPHALAQSTSGSLEDFQLPPGKEALPEIQGPVTPNHPIFAPPSKPVQPKPAAPVAEPELPTQETAAPKPDSEPDSQRAETATQQSVAQPAAAGPRTAAETHSEPDAAPGSTPAPDTATPTVPQLQPAAPAARTAEPIPHDSVAAGTGQTSRGFDWWTYLVALVLLIPMGIGGWMFWQQRRRQPAPIFVRPIERPKPRTPVMPQEQQPEPAVEDIFAGVEDENLLAAPLRHALETTNLGITLINATLSYQLTLTNVSRQMMRDIAVTGDIISAHASLPMEVQLAGPDKAAAPLHQVAVLLPGQSTFLSGEVRLPLGTIRPLRRDNAVMFIPLLRLRITGMGLDHEIVQTCVVGQRPAGPGAGLRPFRLDTGPRIYADIGMRTLDAPAAAVA